MKLLPGDHINIEEVSEDQFDAVCQAFKNDGAGYGESEKSHYLKDKVAPFLGWHEIFGVYFGDAQDFKSGRRLLIGQIIKKEVKWTANWQRRLNFSEN